MSKFIYDKEIPAAILPVLRNNLEAWAWIVPQWCDRVFVGYAVESGKNNETATCYVQYPYRWARLTFYPCFLNQTNPLEDALHELIHISLAVISDYARDRIKVLVPEDDAPKFRETLLSELTERVEAATEDLASRIYAQMK